MWALIMLLAFNGEYYEGVVDTYKTEDECIYAASLGLKRKYKYQAYFTCIEVIK